MSFYRARAPNNNQEVETCIASYNPTPQTLLVIEQTWRLILDII